MKIGLDVMGGDFAPVATIDGAILAYTFLPENDKIVLIGDKGIIESTIKEKNFDPLKFEIIHAAQAIRMDERPIKAFSNKPDSSISIGFRLLKNKKIQSFSSAGNSGATLVGAMYSVGNIPGVIRPATSAFIPQEKGGDSLILDIGTNPDSKPDVLYQFALLGSIYAKNIFNIKKPKVGLLNIGDEDGKGNLLCQSAFHLMKDSKDFCFYGNIESRDIFSAKVDVIICDGFIGNIVLKQIEAMYRLMQKRGLLDDYFRRFNYENYGGSPILGVNSSVVIGHGISNAVAIKNMILLSKEIYYAKLSTKVKRAFKKYTH